MDLQLQTVCLTVCIFSYELGSLYVENEEGYVLCGYWKYVEVSFR
jgi:hypothetical protein